MNETKSTIRAPEKNLVHQVNSWWNAPENATIESIKELFGIEEDKSEKGFGLDFNEIKHGEELLNNAFNNLDKNELVYIETAVLLLDSIYHTRLKSPLRVAYKIHQLFQNNNLLSKIKNAQDLQEIIYCVYEIAINDKKADAKNAYIYSFATKFCNRINHAFPIYDSYVAGLLYHYSYDNKFTQASLGNYKRFYDTYEKFVKDYKLNEFNFKEIDIFMWTYGKILSSKNNKDPIKLQLSVTYVPYEKENI